MYGHYAMLQGDTTGSCMLGQLVPPQKFKMGNSKEEHLLSMQTIPSSISGISKLELPVSADLDPG